MDENTLLADLAQKVQDGTATREEQLQFVKNLNHTSELFLKFIEEVKLAHSAQVDVNNNN